MKVSRIDIIGQNGNDGEHYDLEKEIEKVEHTKDKFQPWDYEYNLGDPYQWEATEERLDKMT